MAEIPGQYSNKVLFGARSAAIQIDELRKLHTTDCLVIPIGTYVGKIQWKINELAGMDRRIEDMIDKVASRKKRSFQSCTWPLFEKGQFPIVCISSESTGKTYTHLLYIVSKLIRETPIAQTDAIILSMDQLDTFSPGLTNKGDMSGGDVADLIAAQYPDQEDIDFNDLGKSKDGKELPPFQDNLDDGDYSDIQPRYIIICSGQQNVENVNEEIRKMKVGAYGEAVPKGKIEELPPKTRAIGTYNNDDKLAMKCKESDILIGTPAMIKKCLDLNFITFARCDKIIFDDFDLAIQLYQLHVKDLAKYYLAQVDLDQSDGLCQICLFSSKWTDLVRQFINTMFTQMILVFASFVEAAQYVGIRFELELEEKNQPNGLPKQSALETNGFNNKLTKILEHLIGETTSNRVAILCKTDKEAEDLAKDLESKKLPVKYLPESSSVVAFKSIRSINSQKLIFVMNDAALEIVADHLNDVKHIIHFTLPNNWLDFDQRYRLMYQHVVDSSKGLASTIFIRLSETSNDYNRLLYDLISRSSITLPSTRLQMRDVLRQQVIPICWRWASTGLCKLDKLSRNDRFGSYCPDLHSLVDEASNIANTRHWPRTGQFKISLTHIICPSEFYFRFEAHRDDVTLDWEPIESSGSEFMRNFQQTLNKFRNRPDKSANLKGVAKGKTFGVYFKDETRVDRVKLLQDLDRPYIEYTDYDPVSNEQCNKQLRELIYASQVRVKRIDHGGIVDVFVKNLIDLDTDVANTPGQCHRGFHVGFKPSYEEPDWSHRARRDFNGIINASNVNYCTVWLRLSNADCFWFEKLTTVNRIEYDGEQEIICQDPFKKLVSGGYAEPVKSDPDFLPPSIFNEPPREELEPIKEKEEGDDNEGERNNDEGPRNDYAKIMHDHQSQLLDACMDNYIAGIILNLARDELAVNN